MGYLHPASDPWKPSRWTISLFLGGPFLGSAVIVVLAKLATADPIPAVDAANLIVI